MSASRSSRFRPRRVERTLASLAATAVAVCLVPLAIAPAADASTPWGTGGASYGGGIVCDLPGGTTVPMSAWSVDGNRAFATADVVETGNVYGPAPTTGASSAITPGQAGLDSTSIAALAYLIAHHGNGTAQEVAQTSAVIAQAAGAGSMQQRCLGQRGTSIRRAQTLWTAAQRFAGPYTVEIGPTPHAKPLTAATVTATVISASDAPTPGISVTFSTGSSQATATTGRDGVARTSIVMPAAADTSIRATASAPVSLTYFASNPPAVTLAAPATFGGTGTLAPVLHPTPRVSVAIDSHLLLAHGRSAITADIGGTYGYSGTGTVTVVGPVQLTTGQSCSTLTDGSFSDAPTAWTGTFDFTGDGQRDAGTTSELAPGCYASKAAITTTDSSPATHASSGYSKAGAITVSAMRITTSTGSGIAPPGPLHAAVTAQDVGAAKVTSSVTAYGPIVTRDGQCDRSLDWSSAPVAGTTTGVDLTAQTTNAPGTTDLTVNGAATTPSTDDQDRQAGQVAAQSADATRLTGVVSTPAVNRLGCYAFATRSTVTEDGMTLVLDTPAGSTGTTTLVLRPQLTIDNGTYDTQQGASMSGHVNIVGAYEYAGLVRIGLQSAKPTSTGCDDAAFSSVQTSATQVAGTTTVRVSGDGDFSFRSPVASRNLCYTVTATLALDANPAVQAPSPSPSSASVFLAGVQLRDAASDPLPHPRADGMFRPVVTMIGTAIVLSIVVLSVVGVGIAARRPRAS